MKKLLPILILLGLTSCTSQKKLAYLSNISIQGDEDFKSNIPVYKLQPRDILHVTIKAMLPDGSINDFLMPAGSYSTNIAQSESGGYIYGYDINPDGDIILPVLGKLKVAGLTLEETRVLIQSNSDKVFKDATVECKLLSFKFTVLGEARIPGTYVNYNNYLTVFEAIGRAGGLGDYGKRNNVLILRSGQDGTTTYRLNLQDKNVLSSEGYYLLPNDVVIVEPLNQKVFNMNLPVLSFILTSVSTSLLLINFFGN